MGVDYKIVQHKRTPELLAPPELENIHPLGKAPIIEDDGKAIAETAVIIEYLVKKYGKLGPPAGDDDAALKYSYWMHFAEGSAAPPLVMSLLFSVVESKVPFFLRPVARIITGGINKGFTNPRIQKQTEYMNAELGKNPENWFVKGFSAADVMMSFPVIATELKVGFEKYPHLAKYLAQARERPAYKIAMEKAGGEFKM